MRIVPVTSVGQSRHYLLGNWTSAYQRLPWQAINRASLTRHGFDAPRFCFEAAEVHFRIQTAHDGYLPRPAVRQVRATRAGRATTKEIG
jgi:hypothetical protein